MREPTQRLAARRPPAPSALALLGLLAGLCLAALGAPAAIAANQQVTVRSNFFVSSTVAVMPGETVTWQSDGTGFHNVHFSDQLYTFPATPSNGPWVATRTFATAGEYRYQCDLHGPGGMSGVVYVTPSGTVPQFPPFASFTALPEVAVPGQAITFDAGPSSDPDGTVVRYQWDFDGNGSFETDAGAREATMRSFETSGTRTVGLQVTDGGGLTHARTRQVAVTDAPTPTFTVSPSVAQLGQAVSFDGSASRDPDGTIVMYEWDLDGNGSYEISGEASTASRTYAGPTSPTISLRVSDNLGIRAVTTRALEVSALAPPPPPLPPPPASQPAAAQPPPPATAPPPAGCGALERAARTTCMQKVCRALKGSVRAACVAKSCRHVTGAKRASCVQTSCRYVAAGRRASCNRASCRHLTGAQRKVCARRHARKPPA